MKRPLLTLVLPLAACAHLAFAQPPAAVTQPTAPKLSQAPAPTDISALLEPIAAEHPVPALAAVLISGNHIVMEGVTGIRAMGSPDKATLDDQWHLGSCTKAMTATLAAMLVEAGAITWDATPITHFPDIAANADPSWNDATLLRLVTNRAGAPKDLSPRGLWGKLWRSNETPPNLRRILLQDIVAHPTDYPPGTSYQYSNTNFAIAGMLAEKAALEPWESLVQRTLFRPLGITSAGFGAPGLPGVTSQPRGHSAEGTPREPAHDADNPQAIAPAGTVHMSIRDWAKFVSLHLRGDAANPHRACAMLTPESFDLLHTAPEGADYAGGWSVTKREWGGGEGDAKGRVLTHGGSNTSWFCVVWMAPARDIAVMACTNIAGEHGPKAADRAVWALIQKHQKE